MYFGLELCHLKISFFFIFTYFARARPLARPARPLARPGQAALARWAVSTQQAPKSRGEDEIVKFHCLLTVVAEWLKNEDFRKKN